MMLLALLVLIAAAQRRTAPGPRRLFRRTPRLEKLWGEGSLHRRPRGSRRPDGAIVFSDIGDRILRFDPEHEQGHRLPRAQRAGPMALVFDPKGRLIAAEGANAGGGRRVSITELDGTVRTLADRYKEQAVQQPE